MTAHHELPSKWRPKFTITGLLVAIAFCAALLGWWTDHARLQQEVETQRARRVYFRESGDRFTTQNVPQFVENYPLTGIAHSFRGLPAGVDLMDVFRNRGNWASVVSRCHTTTELNAYSTRLLRIYEQECRRLGHDTRFRCVWNIDHRKRRVGLQISCDDTPQRVWGQPVPVPIR